MNGKKKRGVSAVAVLLAVLLSACGGGGGLAWVPATTTVRDVSSWAYADTATVNGINKNPANTAWYPQIVVLGSKLYAAWSEVNSGILQVRVAVYNGNDASPSWTFVDGNGGNGINKDVTMPASNPELTVFNGKLYATWSESNPTATQIRVAVYNGNDASPSWAFVDRNGTNGINKDVGQNGSVPQLTIFGSKLYAIWYESGSANQVRVAVYNGNDGAPSWAFVDGNGVTGMNKNPLSPAFGPQLTVFGSKLYATWNEANGVIQQIRVAVYNGNDTAPSWAFVDGNGANGINKDPAHYASAPQLTVLGTKLYAIWEETNAADQTRVAVYNGNDGAPSWAFVDGNGANGINKDVTRNAVAPQLTVFGSKLYATWEEFNGTTTQIRVAIYNGNDSSPSWTFVDGNGVNGINKDISRFAFTPQITAFGSKLYATWVEYNGASNQVRIAVGQ